MSSSSVQWPTNTRILSFHTLLLVVRRSWLFQWLLLTWTLKLFGIWCWIPKVFTGTQLPTTITKHKTGNWTQIWVLLRVIRWFFSETKHTKHPWVFSFHPNLSSVARWDLPKMDPHRRHCSPGESEGGSLVKLGKSGMSYHHGTYDGSVGWLVYLPIIYYHLP